ncbi:hypothetical protein SANTM175S_02524 [Streptomyces antimycoticus]
MTPPAARVQDKCRRRRPGRGPASRGWAPRPGAGSPPRRRGLRTRPHRRRRVILAQCPVASKPAVSQVKTPRQAESESVRRTVRVRTRACRGTFPVSALDSRALWVVMVPEATCREPAAMDHRTEMSSRPQPSSHRWPRRAREVPAPPVQVERGSQRLIGRSAPPPLVPRASRVAVHQAALQARPAQRRLGPRGVIQSRGAVGGTAHDDQDHDACGEAQGRDGRQPFHPARQLIRLPSRCSERANFPTPVTSNTTRPPTPPAIEPGECIRE